MPPRPKKSRRQPSARAATTRATRRSKRQRTASLQPPIRPQPSAAKRPGMANSNLPARRQLNCHSIDWKCDGIPDPQLVTDTCAHGDGRAEDGGSADVVISGAHNNDGAGGEDRAGSKGRSDNEGPTEDNDSDSQTPLGIPQPLEISRTTKARSPSPLQTPTPLLSLDGTPGVAETTSHRETPSSIQAGDEIVQTPILTLTLSEGTLAQRPQTGLTSPPFFNERFLASCAWRKGCNDPMPGYRVLLGSLNHIWVFDDLETILKSSLYQHIYEHISPTTIVQILNKRELLEEAEKNPKKKPRPLPCMRCQGVTFNVKQKCKTCNASSLQDQTVTFEYTWPEPSRERTGQPMDWTDPQGIHALNVMNFLGVGGYHVMAADGDYSRKSNYKRCIICGLGWRRLYPSSFGTCSWCGTDTKGFDSETGRIICIDRAKAQFEEAISTLRRGRITLRQFIKEYLQRCPREHHEAEGTESSQHQP